MTSNADCGIDCDGIGIVGLRGFYHSTVTNKCYCLFDDGIVSSPEPPGFDGYESTNPGTGEIVSSLNAPPFYSCYKIDVSDLQLVRWVEVSNSISDRFIACMSLTLVVVP